MLVVTTPTVEGAPIKQYIGMVSGETFAGVNMFKDFGASLSNMFGGRASQYEEEIGNAAATAVNEMCARAQSMGANAVVGVKVDYFTAGADNGMLACDPCGRYSDRANESADRLSGHLVREPVGGLTAFPCRAGGARAPRRGE